jgi:hypothetical protein
MSIRGRVSPTLNPDRPAYRNCTKWIMNRQPFAHVKLIFSKQASMKVPDGQNPEVLAATNPTYAHLKEPLHVLCEYEG